MKYLKINGIIYDAHGKNVTVDEVFMILHDALTKNGLEYNLNPMVIDSRDHVHINPCTGQLE